LLVKIQEFRLGHEILILAKEDNPIMASTKYFVVVLATILNSTLASLVNFKLESFADVGFIAFVDFIVVVAKSFLPF
jgi:hypothetical protein